MKQYSEVAAFVAVGEAGSFSGGAKRLKVQKSTVSRQVAALEARLGMSLFVRTTRKLQMTELGKRYFEEVHGVFRLLDQVEAGVIASKNDSPEALTGVIRLTAPTVLGHVLLPEVIQQFCERYPKIEVDLVLSDRVMDLVSDHIDIAIRTGTLDPSSLIAKRLGSTQFSLFASPHYLRVSGAERSLRHPSELKNYRLIVYYPDDEAFAWTLIDGAHRFKVKASGILRSNTLQMAHELARAGAGIALLPDLITRDALISGELVHVLPSWRSERSHFSVVYHKQSVTLPGVKALVQHLSKSLAGAT